MINRDKAWKRNLFILPSVCMQDGNLENHFLEYAKYPRKLVAPEITDAWQQGLSNMNNII